MIGRLRVTGPLGLLTEELPPIMAYGDDWEICDLLCVASPLLGAREGFGNPDCVHIVVRFTIAHIIDILLCCYTLWHGDGIWD